MPARFLSTQIFRLKAEATGFMGSRAWFTGSRAGFMGSRASFMGSRASLCPDL